MYCNNNTIMLVDDSGNLPKWAKVVIGLGAIVALGVLSVATAGATGD